MSAQPALRHNISMCLVRPHSSPTRRRVSRGVRVCPAAAAAAADVDVGVGVEAPALRHTLPGPRTQRVGRVRFTRTRRVRARGRGVLLRRKRVGVVAFVRRRVLARRLSLAARECGENLVPLHGRRPAAATRTRARRRARRRRIRSRRRSRSRRRTLTSPASDAREAPLSGGGGAGERVSWFEREKRRESVRRRNSASDRAPRLRRRPSSARRPRSLKKKIEEEDFIANGDLGRAVKDALRVCKWKTRVAFLIILLSLARVCLSDSQTTRSWTRLRSTRRIPTPNQTLLHASEKQRQAEATRGLAGCSARFGPRRRAGRRSGAVPRRTPRRETRPKRGVLGGNTARRARVSSVARSYSPSRAPDPLGGSPRVPNRGTFGVRAVRPESKVCPSSVYSHGENRARGTA